jgi:hypothetical protein
LPPEDSLDSVSLEIPQRDRDKEIDILANSLREKISVDEIMANVIGLNKL